LRMQTDIKTHIQTLINEIEIYRSHSLFAEAKGKCNELAELIRKNDQLKNKQKLLAAVSKKMKDLENDSRQFEEGDTTVQMSTTELDLVKTLFTPAKEAEADSTALEAAIALLVFGQFEKALNEFYDLLSSDTHRVVAAKNILRCHIGLSDLDSAITLYRQWHSSGDFPVEELRKIHSFLIDKLQQMEIDENLPEPERKPDVEEEEAIEEEFVDILSVKIPLDDGSGKRTGIKLDVSFQKGNMFSVIIPRKNQTMIDGLKAGLKIEDIRFYSPAVVFMDSCMVSAIEEIASGPKKGDYTMVMEILDI
jgi:tetratricopeptide (TPR) repeat protein